MEQRHIIKRQIIELTVQDPATAPALQDQASRVYRQRIVPLIDRYCTELGHPDRVYRIESLELDLGILDAENFEEQFLAKVDTTLRQALAAQINSQEQDSTQTQRGPKAQSALELFTFFVRTGSLPWWADDSQPKLLAGNLQQLLNETPQELRGLLQELARDEQMRQRIVSQYGDEQLGQLAGLLVPVYAQSFRRDIKPLKSLLQKTKTGADWPPSRLRHALWDTLLEMAAFPEERRDGVGGQQYPTLAAFYRAALERVAAKLGKTGGALRAEIGQVLQAGQTGGSRSFKELLKALVDVSANGELLRLLVQHQLDSEGPLAEVWAGLWRLAHRLSAPLQTQWLSATKKLGKRPAPQRVLQLLQSELVTPSPEELSGLAQMLQSTLGTKNVDPELAARRDALTVSGSETSAEDILRLLNTDLRFSDADELSVANAGLVILWPFLTSFFTHLGLMEDKQFKDLPARQRSVGLLQVLATQEAAPPEYLLPLNKLLCGMELKQVFDFGPLLLKSEKKECASLLKAVIAQAPILHNMSAAGFRGSFLLRPGLLSVRDGSWLLRVERKSYDIVLERFPWGWQWVKLPWMETPLRVEW